MKKTALHIDGGTTPSMFSLGYFSLLFCVGISAALVLFYFYIIWPYVNIPADILMWSETNFIGDIIKLLIGAPIYMDPADSNSMIYTPAPQLLTYAISWLISKSTSIAALRIIQLCFVFCSALVATVCCRMLHRLSYPDNLLPFSKTWLVFTFFAMFLAATAPRVNAFAHCLHADALSLLVSIFSFWTILYYLSSPNWKRIILMAMCPAIGYLTKQFLISWAAVMFIFLFLNSPRKIKQLTIFVIATGLFIIISISICYLLWGDNFIFWTFEVMGGERKKIIFSTGGFHISLARSMEHVIRAWMEIFIGVVGGWLILKGHNIRRLGPLWISWVVLVLFEALSSGSGWGVLYHFGPGVAIGAIWLFSAIPYYWPFNLLSRKNEFSFIIYDRIKPFIALACIMTFFIALRVVPTMDKNEARFLYRKPPTDIYRYISDIEREFEGLSIDKVLLDIGNWIYLRHEFIAKDRAIPIADQPPGNYKNLDIIVKRISNKTYDKILVRDFHSEYFLYDWGYWPKPSGVKKALLDHYIESRIIPAVKEIKGSNTIAPILMHTGAVSVFIPKININEALTSYKP